MNKPVIGIVGKPSIESDMWHYMEFVDDIRYSLIKSNALVIGILPTDNKISFKDNEDIDSYILSVTERQDLESILERLDGVILEGGLVSNQYEEEIVKICVLKDIPIIGICSGFNNMIRALGGSVHIDSNIFHNQFGAKVAHEVIINRNSKLYKILNKDNVNVNSIHTCIAMEDEIKEYKIVAKCPIDNTVEAIELDNKRFVMGIKWHPELMESMNPIFEEFVKECNKKNVLQRL